MLRWEKDIDTNGHWMGGYIGFDDDCPLYKVGKDDNGWYYDYLPECVGVEGYDTTKEAMDAADKDLASHQIEIDWEEERLSPEELYEILGDRLYEQRRDEKMGW